MKIKKLFPVFLFSLFILSACSPVTEIIKDAMREQSSTSTSRSSSEEEASSSSSSDENKEVMTRTFTGKEDNIDRTDVVTYQGNTFLTLKIEAIDDFPAEAKESLDAIGKEAFKEVWLEALKSEQEVVATQSLEGVELSYDVTDDHRMKVTILIDMQKVDAEKASKIPYLNELNIKEKKTVLPTLYIASLKLNGFKEVK